MSAVFAHYRLAGTAASELFFGWASVRWLPFRRVAAQLGKSGSVAAVPQVDATRTIAQVAWSIQAVARRSPVTFTCLMQAMAAQRMLRRRGVPATVYIAMRASAPLGDPLQAHAWVRCGDHVVVGACDESQYRVIATFA